MSEPFKNLVSKQVITKLGDDLKAVYPQFQTEDFIKSIMDETWEGLEL